MKLRWWVVGTIALMAGGMLVIKHLVDNKEKPLDFVDNEKDKNFSEFAVEYPQSEFDSSDYLF